MADVRKVHPDCVNAANPYHECVEECYMKIANGKPRKGSSKNLGYRPAGYNTPKKDPRPPERRVNGACPSASNPYHECGDRCSQKSGEAQRRSMNGKGSGSGSAVVEAPQTMSRRANKEPNPQIKPSVVVNSMKTSVSPTMAPSSPLNFPSKVSEIEELEPEKELFQTTKPLSPSVMYSGELRPQEFSFNKAQAKSSYSPPASGSATPVLGLSPDHRTLRDHLKETFASVATSTPSTDDNDHHDFPRKTISNNGEIPQNHVRGSMNGSISDTDRSSEETDDAQSVVSEARVPIGKYQVKSSVSSILRTILEKHGDIAESCLLESVAMRSYYLESVCFVVQELQSTTSFMNLTKPKVKEMEAIVKDLEASRMDVGWLRVILQEVSQVMEFVSQNQAVKAAKVKCDQGLELTRRKMEFQVEDLSRKEKEVTELKVKVAETRQRLEEVEAEVAQLDETVASLNAQIDKFGFKTLLQQLL